MPERITDAELAKLKELPSRATLGPHQARFIYRMIRAVRLHATTLGLMLQPDDTRDWADAELWAESANHLPALIAEIEAKRKRDEFKRRDICRCDGDYPQWLCLHCHKLKEAGII